MPEPIRPVRSAAAVSPWRRLFTPATAAGYFLIIASFAVYVWRTHVADLRGARDGAPWDEVVVALTLLALGAYLVAGKQTREFFDNVAPSLGRAGWGRRRASGEEPVPTGVSSDPSPLKTLMDTTRGPRVVTAPDTASFTQIIERAVLAAFRAGQQAPLPAPFNPDATVQPPAFDPHAPPTRPADLPNAGHHRGAI